MEQRLALFNTFFRTPKREVPSIFQSSKADKTRYHLDHIFPHPKGSELICNVSVRRSLLLSPELNHNLVSVYVKVCLLGRHATSCPRRDTTPKRRAIDPRKLTANPKLQEKVLRVTLENLGPLTTGTNATDMAASLAEVLLSTATDVALREKRQRGWCGSADTQKETENA